MVTTYSSSALVSAFIQSEPFGMTTNPTSGQVDNIINRMEDRIDQKLVHGWREKTSKLMFVNPSFFDFRNGTRFDLPNYNVKTLLNGTDTLEVWDGSEYVDFLADKTEGRDEDYWLDGEKGVLFVRNGIQRSTKKPIRIKYRYGEDTVPGEIEDLCTLMAAKQVLMMYQRAIRFVDDGVSAAPTIPQRIDLINEELKDLWISLSNIGTL